VVVPVTARLSQKFYDKLGEDVANELVDWFNAVDATYRADLRELNELNFARFDAKLEQRMAESDVKWERRIAELRVELQKVRADLIKWTFAFWAPTTLGVVALLLRR
jgi:hypothetical protein